MTTSTLERRRFALVPVGFALCIFIGMLVFLQVGRSIGIKDIETRGVEERRGVDVVDGAVYSLLALLVGFTFSGAAARFDSRRQLVVQEVSAIGTAWQRIDAVPIEQQDPIRHGFRGYLDVLLAMYMHPRSMSEALRESPMLSRAQSEVWELAVHACLSQGGEQARMLLLPAMNDMFGAVEKERLARRIHPPIVIFAMLAIMAFAGALLAGFGMASPTTHNWVHMVGLAATISAATYVITDLEFPRLGLIRIDAIDQALVELRETMG